jgi:pyruvate formate lyase activating enzyme
LDGLILELQRLSTEDGPGLRTTVFFKGCPLSCVWCHNPESISARPEVQWVESRCVNCGLCVGACPEGVLSAGPGIAVDRGRCLGCGECARECPSGAMELLGTRWGVEALADELEKDRAYFEGEAGGGITLSGGEPALQAPFAAGLMRELRGRSLEVALDTCGECSAEALESLAEMADIVLFDLKEMDDARHRMLTGRGNARILANFELVVRVAASLGTRLWVRTPVIPGATDRAEGVAAIGRFIAATAHGMVERWELCAFNNLSRDKYSRLGRSFEFAKMPLMAATKMDRLATVARGESGNERMVCWSGMTGRENGE